MSNYRITEIDNLDSLLNGSLNYLDCINPNQIGKVVDGDKALISFITPIMLLSWKKPDNYISKIKKLINNGANLDKRINYFGIIMNTTDVLKKYNIKID
jgi:hypothetical protein